MPIRIKRPERTVELCTDAALQADWEAAEKALAEARKTPAQTMGGAGEANKLAEQVRQLEGAMRESVVRFRLRALPRSEWVAIHARHKAGKDASEADKQFGAKMETFFEEVIPKSVVAVTDHAGDPIEFDAEAEWGPLADDMTERQYSDFCNAVFNLNRGEVSVPFSRAASRRTPASSES